MTVKTYKFDLYKEVVSSRKASPIIQELIKRSRNGDYARVIVFKLDRWARSSKELIVEIQELIVKGVRFHSLADNLDFSICTGHLHFQILAAFSEFEGSLISQRTYEGLNRTISHGKILDRPKESKDSRQDLKKVIF